MRRDMDLVREVLSEVADEGPRDAEDFVRDGLSVSDVAYHFDIMQQAGLIEASVQRSSADRYRGGVALQLTWQGQDFLAAVGSDAVWVKVKRALRDCVGDATLGTVKSIGAKLGAAAIEAQLGI